MAWRFHLGNPQTSFCLNTLWLHQKVARMELVSPLADFRDLWPVANLICGTGMQTSGSGQFVKQTMYILVRVVVCVVSFLFILIFLIIIILIFITITITTTTTSSTTNIILIMTIHHHHHNQH